MAQLGLIKAPTDVAPFSKMLGTMQLLSEYVRQTQFKRLMQQILRIQRENHVRAISILSMYPQEGKSFLTAALALGYAKFLDSRVLILDTNDQTKRRSIFLESIKKDQEICSAESKNSRGSIDVMTTKSSEIGDFDCVDFQIERFVNQIKRRYDVVLVDTCSLSSASEVNIDPIIVAQATEGSVLVTSQRSHNREILTRVKRDLSGSEVELFGVAFNSGVTR